MEHETWSRLVDKVFHRIKIIIDNVYDKKERISHWFDVATTEQLVGAALSSVIVLLTIIAIVMGWYY
jgi:hypothetical protein